MKGAAMSGRAAEPAEPPVAAAAVTLQASKYIQGVTATRPVLLLVATAEGQAAEGRQARDGWRP